MAQLSFEREGELEQGEKPRAEISAVASITDISYSSVNVTLFHQLQKAAEDMRVVSGERSVAFNVWKDTRGTRGCCTTWVCQSCGAPKSSVLQPSGVGVMGQTGQGIGSIIRDLLVFRGLFTTSPHFCAGY